jgi:hypothetical protein
MATASTKHTTSFAPDLEAATERVRAANERFFEASRKITGAYLDGVERYVSGLTDYERKVGEQSQVEIVASLLGAHAKLTDDVTTASLSVARELIAA